MEKWSSFNNHDFEFSFSGCTLGRTTNKIKNYKKAWTNLRMENKKV